MLSITFLLRHLRRQTASALAMAAVLLFLLPESTRAASVLIIRDQSPLYTEPRLDASIGIRLAIASALRADPSACPVEGWCRVYSQVPYAEGWIATSDIARSKAVEAYENRGSPEALLMLRAEREAATSPLVRAWLSFFEAYAEFEVGEVERADARLVDLARSSDHPWQIYAQFARGRLRARRGQLEESVAVYQELLRASPDARVEFYGCILTPVMPGDRMCAGDVSIRERVSATQALQRAQRASQSLEVSKAPAQRRAEAWLELGQAWQRRNEADPGNFESPAGQTLTTSGGAMRRSYDLPRARLLRAMQHGA